MSAPASGPELAAMHAYWRAANYLTVGQIYLQDNPLLRAPLRPEHVKPRLLGHWGTSPGLSLVYVHLNRLIRETDADVILLVGPGHGGPASCRGGGPSRRSMKTRRYLDAARGGAR